MHAIQTDTYKSASASFIKSRHQILSLTAPDSLSNLQGQMDGNGDVQMDGNGDDGKDDINGGYGDWNGINRGYWTKNVTKPWKNFIRSDIVCH